MRYSRQILLKGIGKKGQKKLSSSTVAIVGLGALGTASAELLTRAGIGKLILIDRDIIELSNLQRQSLFTEEDLGKPKVLQAEKQLKKINSEIKIQAHFEHLDYNNINLLSSDLILDCTDNLYTRFLINEYSIKTSIPWIYSSCLEHSGYVFNIIPGKICFNCIFNNLTSIGTCDTLGVLNTLANLISSLQVNEAFKILLNKSYEKNLLYINIWQNKIEKIKVKKLKNCNACNKNFKYLTGERSDKLIKFCGSDNYLIKGSFNYLNLKKKLKKYILNDWENSFKLKNLIIFKNKNVLIKAESEKQAKSIYSKFIGD